MAQRKQKAVKEKASRAKQDPVRQYAPYVVLVILVAIYALYNNIILGLAIFLFIIALVLMELKTSVKSEGTRKSAIDIVVALVCAVVLWGALVIFLQTRAPIDAVASCSMLPTLHRGDLVFLHGMSNASAFLEQHHVPVVNVSQAQFSKMYDNINTEYLAYFAYVDNNKSRISEYVNATNYPVALYNTYCLDTLSSDGQPNLYYECTVQSQEGLLVKYNYSIRRTTINGALEYAIDTSMITIGNTTINESYTNPIMVYETTSQDYFSGDIIHRLVAAIRVGNEYYFLTKGDNNAALDMQFGNYPPDQSQIVGYTVLDVPVLGYIKLILDGQIGSVPGCNQQITN